MISYFFFLRTEPSRFCSVFVSELGACTHFVRHHAVRSTRIIAARCATCGARQSTLGVGRATLAVRSLKSWAVPQSTRGPEHVLATLDVQ